MAVGSQAIEVGCVVPLESGHIELPVSDEFVKNKTAVAMGGRWFFWVNFRTVIWNLLNYEPCLQIVNIYVYNTLRTHLVGGPPTTLG